jgi:hypothetical protein
MRKLGAACWKDKQEVFVLTNIHVPAAQGNLRDECDNTMKPPVIKDYSILMGYVDKSD